jgi:putative peptide zinc metalloprotease protein
MAKDTTPASDLERRKKVRLRVRHDLSIAPQKYEGKTYYVVKDPVSLRYYRFKEQEHFLIRMMNGKHTLDDAQKAFEKQFRPDRLTLEDLEGFGQQLLNAGLAQNESPQAGKQLFDRRKKRRRSELVQMFTNILYIKIPLFDPDRLLSWMLTRLVPALRRIELTAFWTVSIFVVLGGLLWGACSIEALQDWVPPAQAFAWFVPLFRVWGIWGLARLTIKVFGFLFLSVLVMLAAVSLVLIHFQTFYSRLPSYHEFFSFKTIIYLWAALGIVKVIHEFGHGLSCKAYGGEVHEMGLLFLCLSPCMYCNVSDAWTLPNKWKRIIISGAGIYVELIIASIATFVWWNTPSQPFVNYMSLSLMVVCSVSTFFFNANPLMRYDGYYVVADWLEIPNLRDRSNRYLGRLVTEHCLGIEVQPEPYMELGRRILFVTYAIVSYIYRWVVTFVILWFMYNFLKPYKLGVISALLAFLAAGSMVGWPIYRLCKNIHKRGRIPDMKPLRVTISACVVAALLALFFFLPLPISRVRQTGLVEIEPGKVLPVYLHVQGRLEKILVREGQEVKKGTVLAEFSNLEMQRNEEDERGKYIVMARKYQYYLHLNVNNAIIERDKNYFRSERDALKAKWLYYRDHPLRRLVLRAPRAGTVIGVPRPEELGSLWGIDPDVGRLYGTDTEQEKPFCVIGQPNRLRVRVPVSPADYRLIRNDLARAEKDGRDLYVTIRVQGRDWHTWKGTIDLLPDSEAREIPIQLSNKGGGPLAVKANSRPKYVVQQALVEPQTQVYLIGIKIEDPDSAICPGCLAQVKIHLEHRTCAWAVWRWINATLDLGLM